MTDMTAFERQVAGELLDRAGPVRPVDDLAVFESTTASSRRSGWAFTTFSALKFVAAAAIVALFGGFLLAGVLSSPHDGDGIAPAAMSASPSPMTSEQVLAGMVTEEVEPGLFRIINDGVRDISRAVDIVVGDNGSLWGVRDDGIFQLGGEAIAGPKGRAWLPGWAFVTPDGTFWVGLFADDDGSSVETIWTYDGEAWTPQPPPPAASDLLQVYSLNGAIWAIWPDPRQRGQSIVAALDNHQWRLLDVPLQHFAGDEFASVELLTTDGEDLWAWSGGAPFGGSGEMLRWVDDEWRRVFGAHDGRAGEPFEADLLALGSDGTTWLRQAEFTYDDNGEPGVPFASLRSFDGGEWHEWSLEDLKATVTTEGGVGGIGVSPDGSLWISLGETWPGADDVGAHVGVEAACHGLARFDGERWHRYLADLCTDSLELRMGPDGSVWTWAGAGFPGAGEDWGDGQDPWDLYVITPQAYPATE